MELAKKIHADGVHIGQSDMEIKNARELLGADKIIGVTAKTIEQAKAAETAGADYLGSGAVFGTSTKADAKPMELDLFQEICESVTIPVVAIGGINADNVLRLKGRKMAAASDVYKRQERWREQQLSAAFSHVKILKKEQKNYLKK